MLHARSFNNIISNKLKYMGQNNNDISQQNLSKSQKVPTFHDSHESQKQNCRVCLEEQRNTHDSLIAPCLCSGSVKHVHLDCFTQWIVHRYHKLTDDKQKQQMIQKGFQCEICKTNFKIQFDFVRQWVTKEQFGQICRDSVPLTITIILFLLIAVGTFAFLVHFADSTKYQFERKNGTQAFFTILSIIVIVVFFFTGIFFFITRYLWIQKTKIISLKNQFDRKQLINK